jgi:hypothetical protein
MVFFITVTTCLTFSAFWLGRHVESRKQKTLFGEVFSRNCELFDQLNAERLKNQKLEIQISELQDDEIVLTPRQIDEWSKT